MSRFLDFSRSLKSVLLSSPSKEHSPPRLHCLPPGEKHLVSGPRGILFQILCGYFCSTFLAPSCGGIPKLGCLSADLSVHCQRWVLPTSEGGAATPRCCLSSSQWCGPLLCVLTAPLPTLALTTTGNTQGGTVCGRGVWGGCWGARGPAEGSAGNSTGS